MGGEGKNKHVTLLPSREEGISLRIDSLEEEDLDRCKKGRAHPKMATKSTCPPSLSVFSPACGWDWDPSSGCA